MLAAASAGRRQAASAPMFFGTCGFFLDARNPNSLSRRDPFLNGLLGRLGGRAVPSKEAASYRDFRAARDGQKKTATAGRTIMNNRISLCVGINCTCIWIWEPQSFGLTNPAFEV